jgi:16S rRNA (cytosine967-C5)-methyltransferase
LRRVERDRAYATKALAELWRDGTADRDARAFATELALGTLRWRGIIDARLEPLLPRGLASLDDLTRQILRVAAYELLGPRAGAAHAAVHLAVESAKHQRNQTLAGLVNAVLHRLAPPIAETSDEERRTNNATLALPPWLLARFAAAWGEEDANALARWSLERPGRTVRLNRGRADVAAAVAALPGSTVSPLSPWILRLAAGAGDLRDHPLLAAGSASSQEEGAFLAAELLPLRAGARVLDACAGRGTKTAALAERAGVGSRLVAADVNPDKLRRVPLELARLGLPPPETVAVDWSIGSAGLVGAFDAILVDAPCSGTGTLARRPEIRWRLAPDDLARLVPLQAAILARTADLLAPGGTLLYVVCSLLPEEGPEQVRRLLAARPDLSPLPRSFASPPWRLLAHGAALLPHATGTDGFFTALLQRAG